MRIRDWQRRAVVCAVCVCVAVVGRSFAQYDITAPDSITTDTEWFGSVLVDDTLVVDSAATLTIAQGTRVSCADYTPVIVRGAIRATGSEEHPVVFTAVDTTVGWSGIRLLYSETYGDEHLFEHCRFEYALDTVDDRYGGAIQTDRSAPVTIRACAFVGNRAYRGGAISSEDTKLTVEQTIFTGNESASYGSCLEGHGPLTFSECTVESNTGEGCAFQWFAAPDWPTLVSACVFRDNVGGAMSVGSNGPDAFWITSCLFVGNTSTYDAGAIRSDCNSNGTMQVVNSTFVANSGAGEAEHLYSFDGTMVLTNCILWGEDDGMRGNTSNYSLRYCCVAGGAAGLQVTGDNPRFADSARGDFSLAEDSPCRDAGTPLTDLLVLPETDVDGNPRLAGTAIDMGAYEYAPVRVEPSVTLGRNATPVSGVRTVHTLSGRTVQRRGMRRGCYVTNSPRRAQRWLSF